MEIKFVKCHDRKSQRPLYEVWHTNGEDGRIIGRIFYYSHDPNRKVFFGICDDYAFSSTDLISIANQMNIFKMEIKLGR